VKKSDREIMEILEAFDATGCAHSAAQIAGVDPKTVRRYVAARDAGRPVDGTVQRPKIIDSFLGKVEEWVDRSDGTVRADVVHERLQGLGFTGDERTTRRAVAEAKAVWRSGNRRRYRPWITEPGLWLQFDWGTGPVVFGLDGRPRPTLLFCAWLAWSRFRVVLPTWDRRLGTLLTCLDTTLRRLGGVPTYGLTDNEKTVTVDHVAGVPVRHAMIVAAGRHYGLQVHTCVRFDPESKGGSEATVRIAKADLVPTKANLLSGYNSFAELADACEQFCGNVNGRVHGETNRVPAEALVAERSRLHALPVTPFTAALGETRTVNADQTIRFGSVRYSTPPGLVGCEVWVRSDGDELVIVSDTNTGLVEVARHRLSTPGNPADRPVPLPRPSPGARRQSETTPAAWVQQRGEGIPCARSGCALLPGRGRRSRCATGPVEDDRRGRARRAGGHRAGRRRPGVAAAAARFAEGDLLAIVQHRAGGASIASLVIADEAHSIQPGTSAWATFGRQADQ
jgi:transposase